MIKNKIKWMTTEKFLAWLNKIHARGGLDEWSTCIVDSLFS